MSMSLHNAVPSSLAFLVLKIEEALFCNDCND